MKYNIRPTTKFQKDLKRLQRRGYDLSLLTEITFRNPPAQSRRRIFCLLLSITNILWNFVFLLKYRQIYFDNKVSLILMQPDGAFARTYRPS